MDWKRDAHRMIPRSHELDFLQRILRWELPPPSMRASAGRMRPLSQAFQWVETPAWILKSFRKMVHNLLNFVAPINVTHLIRRMRRPRGRVVFLAFPSSCFLPSPLTLYEMTQTHGRMAHMVLLCICSFAAAVPIPPQSHDEPGARLEADAGRGGTLSHIKDQGVASGLPQGVHVDHHRPTIECLSGLQFGANGEVSSNQSFGPVSQCCFYKEGDETFHSPDASPYLYELSPDDGSILGSPPLGMRSSVPLGGLGTGSTELRADGTFADWLVENGGPGLSQNGKIPLKDEMLLAVGLGDFAASVRTSPPSGVLGVNRLEYSGAFPVSRLSIKDARLPGGAMLYAYSPLQVYDEDASGVPAITFSLTISNPSEAAQEARLGLILPLSCEKDQTRGLITSARLGQRVYSSGPAVKHTPPGSIRPNVGGTRAQGPNATGDDFPVFFLAETARPGADEEECEAAVLEGPGAGWRARAKVSAGGERVALMNGHGDSFATVFGSGDSPAAVVIGCGGAGGRLSLAGGAVECMRACRASLGGCASWTWEEGVCFEMHEVRSAYPCCPTHTCRVP